MADKKHDWQINATYSRYTEICNYADDEDDLGSPVIRIEGRDRLKVAEQLIKLLNEHGIDY